MTKQQMCVGAVIMILIVIGIVDDAMLEIGPQLQASQIDPDEVAAWNLVYASLEQLGCAGQTISVRLMKSVSYALHSPAIATNARSLAEKYWQDYGTQILSNLGCGS